MVTIADLVQRFRDVRRFSSLAEGDYDATAVISAADIRAIVQGLADYQDAARIRHGEIYLDGATASVLTTSIASVDVWVPLAWQSTLAEDPPAEDWDSPQDGRLRYLGSVTRHAMLHGGATLRSAGGAHLIGLAIAKNGILQEKSHRHHRSFGAFLQLSIHTAMMIEISSGDYVELLTVNHTGTQDIEATHASLIAAAHFE